MAHAVVEALLAPGAARVIAQTLESLFGPDDRAGPVADLGAGGRARVAFPTVGVDVDVAALRRYSDRDRDRAVVAADAGALPFADASFAAALSVGLLHHLDDASARAVIAECLRIVRPGGLVAVFDAVLPDPPWRRPVAAVIRRLDRGRHMRTQSALEAVLAPTGPWNFRRITYSLTGLEALVATMRGRGE